MEKAKNLKNQSEINNIALRLTLKPEDPLYGPFSDIKEKLGVKNNTEVLRFILKQIAQIPPSDFMNMIKKESQED